MASNLKARFQAEQSEEKRWKKVDPVQFEKQKVFNLMMDTSMDQQSSRIRPSQIKETSFESLNNVENLFITGDDRSSISNQMSRLTQGAVETDQSKVTGRTQDKDTSFIE